MTNAETTNETKTAPIAEKGAQGASKKASSKKDASQAKGAPKGVKAAAPKKETKAAAKKQAEPARKRASKPKPEARDGSKKAIILELLRRTKGATLDEIMKATKWQAHSVRGFISGTLGKKMGINVESAKNEAGDRTYQIAK